MKFFFFFKQELAIIHSASRNATVTCHTDVSVLYIDRDDFMDIFMHIETGKEPDHISFLREIELFNDWPIERLPYNDPRICFLTYFRYLMNKQLKMLKLFFKKV